MKIIRFFVLLCVFTVVEKGLAQGVLEYHYEIGVQRMPDGVNFRFLKGNAGEDWLEEFSTYYFPGYENGDTVAWQYMEEEDQLYIAAWNPARATKKHEVKFAVAWRVTSGNPRYGKVTVPAGTNFAGFGNNRAYFSQAGSAAYLPLFFYDKYIPGLAIVEYTLKVGAPVTDQKPKTNYYTLLDNFNSSAKKIVNPFGPTKTKERRDREEFVKDSTLSVPLQALKKKYNEMPEDVLWGKPSVNLADYDKQVYWEDYRHDGRYYTLNYIYIEDKYCGKSTLTGEMMNDHPELAENRKTSFERVYHENGVSGWKVVCRSFPFMRLKLSMDVPDGTPALVVNYEAKADANVPDFFAPESLYGNNKTVQEMLKAKDAYDKGMTIWARYALDHNRECTAEELKYAFIDMLGAAGYTLDDYWMINSQERTTYNGTVNPAHTNFKIILIGYDPAKELTLQPVGNYKAKPVTLNELTDFKNQKWRMYQASCGFEGKIDGYEFNLELYRPTAEGYIIFLSRPDK